MRWNEKETEIIALMWVDFIVGDINVTRKMHVKITTTTIVVDLKNVGS